ncbi:sigma-54 dependent transcriptional regulator [Desulfovibrio mangrovi]|uniref:sigma-54-dependent transcriptional regulator n=1 Tax=Desulfovibrio mangrovi TaxID=2976983 RepID=UPI0022457566|nr:sigma-54 dependent transcriptional regulator [Desulfovibrio mangrovi]UZP66341.1 sigma-54 dependent transcriptional regulator [Desulfovibrio mangrovi]
MTRVLIIDDDESMRYALTRAVRRMGHDATTAEDLGSGLAMARRENIDAVFLDVHLPDGNGLSILADLAKCPSAPEVIIITGEGDPDGAELAINNGAWDYIEKTDSIQKISLTLKRALDYRRERTGTAVCQPVRALRRDRIVGDSPGLARSLDLVAQAAWGDSNVLIIGETGTGKELFARAIHENSSRAGGPFVVVDCAALPENLVESILFGHRKGAFTGADQDQVGLVIQADGGTLFLDEIGELPLNMQKAFLRVLQERTVRPIGSKAEVHSNFRLVAATNRNLEQMVSDGSFRSDLLFRLQTVRIDIPPLRERKGDIRALATHYAAIYCDRAGMDRKGLYSDFLDTLEANDWPGNVRELVHTIEHAVAAAASEPTLFSKHLPPSLRAAVARSRMTPPQEPLAVAPVKAQASSQPQAMQLAGRDLPPLAEFREAAINEAERNYLQALMVSAEGNIKEIIRRSGVSQSRLYALLKKHNISSQDL